MSAFRRTLRALNEGGFSRWSGTVIFTVALLCAWSLWFVFARISVYETSQSARVELDGTVYPIDTPVTGRVVASNLALGRRVNAGDVLVEIDAAPLVLEQRELETKRSSLANEIEALQRELSVERAAATQAATATKDAVGEATARWNESRAAAVLAAEEVRRAVQLHESGLISDFDLMRLRAEAEKREAAAGALRLSIARQEADDVLKQKERLARCQALERDLASLDGQRRSILVSIERADEAIDRRRVRAAFAGVLADVSTLRPGAVLREGDRIGTLVTRGELRVVASFAANAVGRLRTGQRGYLRLAGYPWQQYGVLPVVVEHVATELRESQIRVEMRLGRAPSGIPLQHALPGSVEVEVERIAPAELVLRSAGRRAAPKAAS